MPSQEERKAKGDIPASNETKPAGAVQSRWPLVAVVAVSLLVGAVVLERLSRPPKEFPQQGFSRASEAAQAGPAGAGSLPTTVDEVIVAARRVADRLVEAFPDDPRALTMGGRIDYAFGDPAKAAVLWEKCLRRQPQFAEAHAAIGVAAWTRGDFPKAAAELQAATQADSRLLPANIFYLADALMNSGKASEAVALLEKTARTSPLSPDGLYVLGQACLQSKDYQKAERIFEAVLAKAPHYTNAHYGLSTALARLGRVEEAKKHRQQYAKLKDKELAAKDRAEGMGRSVERADPAKARGVAAGFSTDAGNIYAVHGRLDDAEKLWLMAVAIDPARPEPRKILEAFYRSQGREEEAVRIAGGNVARRPTHAGN